MASNTNSTTKRPLIDRFRRYIAVCITPGCKNRPQEYGLLCEDCARHAELIAYHARRQNGGDDAA